MARPRVATPQPAQEDRYPAVARLAARHRKWPDRTRPRPRPPADAARHRARSTRFLTRCAMLPGGPRPAAGTAGASWPMICTETCGSPEYHRQAVEPCGRSTVGSLVSPSELVAAELEIMTSAAGRRASRHVATDRPFGLTSAVHRAARRSHARPAVGGETSRPSCQPDQREATTRGQEHEGDDQATADPAQARR